MSRNCSYWGDVSASVGVSSRALKQSQVRVVAAKNHERSIPGAALGNSNPLSDFGQCLVSDHCSTIAHEHEGSSTRLAVGEGVRFWWQRLSFPSQLETRILVRHDVTSENVPR
jgi:hypothetical protein